MFRNLYKRFGRIKEKHNSPIRRTEKRRYFIKKSLNWCSEDERRSYGFGTTCASN